MASTITDRVNVTVGGIPINTSGMGIYQCENVAGTNTVTADTSPDIGGYITNMLFLCRPFAVNTGAVTVNFAEGGAVALLSPIGNALTAGQFDPAFEYLIRFNGTNMRIVSPF